MDNVKVMKMQGKEVTPAPIDTPIEERGVIAPTLPETDADTEQNFGNTPISAEGLGKNAAGSQFWLLAAAGVAAWFIFKK